MFRAWQNSLVHDTSKDYFPIGKFGPYPGAGSGSFWKKQASGLPSLPCWAKDTYLNSGGHEAGTVVPTVQRFEMNLASTPQAPVPEGVVLRP